MNHKILIVNFACQYQHYFHFVFSHIIKSKTKGELLCQASQNQVVVISPNHISQQVMETKVGNIHLLIEKQICPR